MNEKYEGIYRDVESGLYDQEYFSLGEGNVVGVSAKKLKSECSNQGVDFDEFLEYARKRKAEEMKK